jgi:hypothetical protein
MRTLLLAGAIALLSACTSFSATLPTGEKVQEWGGLLVSRDSGFEMRHEWLDADNVLHIVTIKRNSDEQADAQIRALELVRDAYRPAKAATGGSAP